jgi:hypothetical protein
MEWCTSSGMVRWLCTSSRRKKGDCFYRQWRLTHSSPMTRGNRLGTSSYLLRIGVVNERVISSGNYASNLVAPHNITDTLHQPFPSKSPATCPLRSPTKLVEPGTYLSPIHQSFPICFSHSSEKARTVDEQQEEGQDLLVDATNLSDLSYQCIPSTFPLH